MQDGILVDVNSDAKLETQWNIDNEGAEDVVIALVKDSGTLYVYWTLSIAFIRQIEAHFQRNWTECPIGLCVYDVTGVWFDGTNAIGMHYVSVKHSADNWYVHGLVGGRHYVVDFGLHTQPGAWISLLRSNCVNMPSGQMHNPGETPTLSFHPPFQDDEWKRSFTGYSIDQPRVARDTVPPFASPGHSVSSTRRARGQTHLTTATRNGLQVIRVRDRRTPMKRESTYVNWIFLPRTACTSAVRTAPRTT